MCQPAFRPASFKPTLATIYRTSPPSWCPFCSALGSKAVQEAFGGWLRKWQRRENQKRNKEQARTTQRLKSAVLCRKHPSKPLDQTAKHQTLPRRSRLPDLHILRPHAQHFPGHVGRELRRHLLPEEASEASAPPANEAAANLCHRHINMNIIHIYIYVYACTCICS